MSSITGEVKHGKECSLNPAGIVELYLREQGWTYGVGGTQSLVESEKQRDRD